MVTEMDWVMRRSPLAAVYIGQVANVGERADGADFALKPIGETDKSRATRIPEAL